MVATTAAAALACVRVGICLGVLLLLSSQAHGDQQTLRPRKTDSRSPAGVAGEDHTRPLNALGLEKKDGISVMFDGPVMIDARLLDYLSTRLASKATLADATKADTAGFPAQGERDLQAVCSAGDPFTISSAIYPDAEGCFAEVEADSYLYANADVTWAILPVSIAIATLTSSSSSYTTTSEIFWASALIFVDSNSDLVFDAECLSADPVRTGSHPTDVSPWYCQLGDRFYEVTGSGFSAECGCSSDSSTGTGTGDTPAPADASAGTSGCSGTDPFTVTSGLLSDFDGCYSDGGATDQTVFMQAVDGAGGSLAVHEAYIDQAETDERWLVGAYAGTNSTVEPTVDCISQEAPSEAHPADANWVCDFTGTGAYTLASDAQFSIECGCSSSSLPSTSPASTPAPMVDASGSTEPTPSPVATEEPAPAASGDLTTSTSVPAAEPIGAGGASANGGDVRALRPSAIMMAAAALAVGLASGSLATKWRLD